MGGVVGGWIRREGVGWGRGDGVGVGGLNFHFSPSSFFLSFFFFLTVFSSESKCQFLTCNYLCSFHCSELVDSNYKIWDLAKNNNNDDNNNNNNSKLEC